MGLARLELPDGLEIIENKKGAGEGGFSYQEIVLSKSTDFSCLLSLILLPLFMHLFFLFSSVTQFGLVDDKFIYNGMHTHFYELKLPIYFQDIQNVSKIYIYKCNHIGKSGGVVIVVDIL